MRLARYAVFAVAITLSLSVACNRNKTGPDREAITKSLDQAGFGHDVRVDIDRDKNVVTLNGKVRSPELKDKATQVAQQAAPASVISNQLSVEPVDEERAARKIEGNVDEAIDHDYKAVLVANRLDGAGVHYKVKNGVLTLTGRVKSTQVRQEAEQLGAKVPNVSQVVNELQVRKQ